MSVMMEAWEWVRVFESLPEPSEEEMRVFVERKKREEAEREESRVSANSHDAT